MTAQNQFDRKAVVETGIERHRVNFQFSGPSQKMLSFPVKRQLDTFARIGLLIEARNPFAVVSAIVSVYILAFKCAATRAFAHFSKETVEYSPLFANRNPARAVVFIRSVANILTQLDHVAPAYVGGLFGITARKAD